MADNEKTYADYIQFTENGTKYYFQDDKAREDIEALKRGEPGSSELEKKVDANTEAIKEKANTSDVNSSLSLKADKTQLNDVETKVAQNTTNIDSIETKVTQNTTDIENIKTKNAVIRETLNGIDVTIPADTPVGQLTYLGTINKQLAAGIDKFNVYGCFLSAPGAGLGNKRAFENNISIIGSPQIIEMNPSGQGVLLHVVCDVYAIVREKLTEDFTTTVEVYTQHNNTGY